MRTLTNSLLNSEAKKAIAQLKIELEKLNEAKGTLPEKQAKKFAKLVETLTNIETETEAMLEELETRTLKALETNFFNYSVVVTMILSNGMKPTLQTSVRTDDPCFDLKAWIKGEVEKLVKDESNRYWKGATLVSYTFEVKKSGKKL